MSVFKPTLTFGSPRRHSTVPWFSARGGGGTKAEQSAVKMQAKLFLMWKGWGDWG